MRPCLVCIHGGKHHHQQRQQQNRSSSSGGGCGGCKPMGWGWCALFSALRLNPPTHLKLILNTVSLHELNTTSMFSLSVAQVTWWYTVFLAVLAALNCTSYHITSHHTTRHKRQARDGWMDGKTLNLACTYSTNPTTGSYRPTPQIQGWRRQINKQGHHDVLEWNSRIPLCKAKCVNITSSPSPRSRQPLGRRYRLP